jgi:hypothetical protein
MLPRGNSRHGGPGMVDLAVAWTELGAVGDGAIPIRVSRNAVVTVACTDAIRAQQIRAGSEDLLGLLELASGVKLTRMDVVVADHALQIPHFERPAPREIPGASLRAAEQVVSGFAADVTDPDLRDAITRAATVAIARTWDEKGAK